MKWLRFGGRTPDPILTCLACLFVVASFLAARTILENARPPSSLERYWSEEETSLSERSALDANSAASHREAPPEIIAMLCCMPPLAFALARYSNRR